MVKSMYAGVAGLKAHQTKMDVIGNNIANVNTYGFKAGRVTFRDQYYQTISGSTDASGVYGGGNASQIGYGSQVGSVDIEHGRGGFAPTGSALDIMINGGGYFLVGPARTDANGNPDFTLGFNPDGTAIAPAPDLTSLNLTRVGIFNFDGNGNLVDSNNNLVYGYTNTAAPGVTPPVIDTTGANALRPIRIPMEGTPPVPIKLTGVSIGSDGTITGIRDDNSVVTIGQVAIANVPNPNGLEMTQNSNYQAKANTGLVTAHTPGAGTTGKLQAGGLEMSNVDLSKEFSDMITTQRGFQANTRIITVTDEMLQELVNLKR